MLAKRFLFLCGLCLGGLSTPLSAASLTLDAPPAVLNLLRPYLPEEAGSPRRLQNQLSEILATEGYFKPIFELTPQGEQLHVRIEPGPLTHITAIDLEIQGALPETKRAQLILQWKLPVGQIFRQDDWNSAKQQVLNELLASEFADARLNDSEALIDADTASAQLRLRYDAGPRYRFGEVQTEGLTHLPADLIQRYNRRVRPGALYREEDLAALQNALRATPYFSSVQVTLAREASSELPGGERSAPVRISVRERSPQRLAFGAGASTNTGARLETNYQHVNFLERAWELNSGLRLEERQQTAYADVFLPPDERNRRHSVGILGEGSDIQGLRTTRYAFGAQRIQLRGSVEQRLSLHWEQEERRSDGTSAATSRALAPNALWIWRSVDNPLDPRRGTVLQGQIGGGSRALLSDQNFVRLHGRLQQYVPLGRRDNLLLRAELGRTFAPGREHIPQDFLFRTGGAGSVRGYAYQSLGVKDGSSTMGGRYLAVLSAEATHWLDEQWGIAAFVDAGDAVDRRQESRLALGYGLGARWKSPAGPLGIDLAYGERTQRMQLHFALSIPF